MHIYLRYWTMHKSNQNYNIYGILKSRRNKQKLLFTFDNCLIFYKIHLIPLIELCVNDNS